MPNFDIYVINLDKDKDRLQKFTKMIFPNPFTRISAIYGKNVDIMNNNQVFVLSKYLTPYSIIGSGLSHKLAVQTFLNNSEKDIALIFEDDAEPTTPNYMKEIQNVIDNAPADWDIIKLDYFPINTSINGLLTAYLINKKGANKFKDLKIIYYLDVDLHFRNLNIYKSPKIIFEQIWNESNNSNTRHINTLNPLNYIFTYTGFQFKIIRFGNIEFSTNDILFFITLVISIYILYKMKVTLIKM